jgi:ankyrin repeat protein
MSLYAKSAEKLTWHKRLGDLYEKYDEAFVKIGSLIRHGKYTEVEELLIDPNWMVTIDYQDDAGNTLLHIASQNGNKRIVKLCLRHGASLDKQNSSGQTALHFAFGYNYTDLGEYIISKGANDTFRNNDGLTCYQQQIQWSKPTEVEEEDAGTEMEMEPHL